jgi:hypothetical protein
MYNAVFWYEVEYKWDADGRWHEYPNSLSCFESALEVSDNLQHDGAVAVEISRYDTPTRAKVVYTHPQQT